MTPHYGGCRCQPQDEMHGTACPIIREFKLTPAQRLEEYRAEGRARRLDAERDGAVDVSQRLQKLGVPYDAINAVRNLRDTRSTVAARRFLTEPREKFRTLVLVGPRGVGKSTAGALVLADAARKYDWNGQVSGGKQNAPMAWVNAAEVTSAVDFGRVDPEWLAGLRSCRTLILDDLGKDATAPGLIALRDLLTARHENLKTTVVTSNLTPADFVERYGASWYERLKTSSLVPDLRKEESLRRKVG